MFVLGATQKDIDMEVRNLTADEIAFVQVKSSADQAALDHYIEQFEAQSDRYARMIFAVHTPHGLTLPTDDPRVQVWMGERIARLVVELGLGEWVERTGSLSLLSVAGPLRVIKKNSLTEWRARRVHL